MSALVALKRLVLTTVMVAILPISSATAFERTTTCYTDPQSQFPCEDGESPIPIYWPRSCLAFHIQEDDFSAIEDTPALHELIGRSFESWNADCSYLQLSFGGLTDERRIGYDICGGQSGNANVVSFVETDWTHAPRAVALTSVTYSVRDGRIYDADIEMNAQHYPLGVVPAETCDSGSEDGPCAWTDIENALTHEVGHVIGLDHTLAPTFMPGEGEVEADFTHATMYAETVSGETTKRDLAHDDIAGVCAIYPIDSPDAPTCQITNDGDFRAPSRAYDDPCPDEGCACTHSLTPSPHKPLSLIGIALLGIVIRRRRVIHRPW